MGKDTTTKHLFDDGYTTRSYTSGGSGSTYGSGSSGSFLDSVSAYGASVAQRERAYWHPETTGPDKRMEKRNEKQREKLKQEDWLERAGGLNTFGFWQDLPFHVPLLYGYLIALGRTFSNWKDGPENIKKY